MTLHKTFDKLLELRDGLTEAAEVADANEAGVAMDGLVPTHGSNIDQHHTVDVVFSGIVIGGSVDPTGVVFVIDTDSEVAFGDTPVEIARINYDVTSKPTELIVPIHMDTLRQLDPDAAAIRCGVEVTGGTSPTVQWSCYIAKH